MRGRAFRRVRAIFGTIFGTIFGMSLALVACGLHGDSEGPEHGKAPTDDPAFGNPKPLGAMDLADGSAASPTDASLDGPTTTDRIPSDGCSETTCVASPPLPCGFTDAGGDDC